MNLINVYVLKNIPWNDLKFFSVKRERDDDSPIITIGKPDSRIMITDQMKLHLTFEIQSYQREKINCLHSTFCRPLPNNLKFCFSGNEFEIINSILDNIEISLSFDGSVIVSMILSITDLRRIS